jgi:hypothetical protein
MKDKDHKLMKCKNCKVKTNHIKCGFGIPGGICGNGRYRCSICGDERY